MSFRPIILSLTLTTVLVPSAFAANRTWTGPNGGDWTNAANWGGVVPGGGDNALINTSTGPNVVTTVGTVNEVRLGTTNGGTGNLTGSAGGVVSDATGYVGYIAGSTGSATVTGAGSTWTNSGVLRVGNNGTGTLTISNGGTVTAGATSDVGSGTGSSGTATVTGSGSSLSVTGFLNVGQNGNGVMLVDNGGTVSSTDSNIGNLPGSVSFATVDGSGSSWNTSNTLQVGREGTGTLTISNGGDVTAVLSTIGRKVGGNGTVIVTGSGSNLSNSGSLELARDSTGTLTIADGATVSAATGATMATNTGSVGTLNIGAATGAAVAPGTLSVSTVAIGAGTGVINFNHTSRAYVFAPAVEGNGTINALAGNTLLAGDTSGFTGTVNVSSGANITTGAAVTKSMQNTAGAVQEAMVTSRAAAGELLGAARPVDQENRMGGGAMFGSIAGMVGGQYTVDDNALIGGVAYGEADRSGIDQDPAVTIAAAVRHSYPDMLDSEDGQTLTPYIEAGGWITPDQHLTLSRRYDIIGGGGASTGETDTTAWAGYGRVGLVWDAGPDQLAGYGEIGKQSLSHDGYTETGGPFPATIEDGTMRFKVVRVGGSYTREMNDIAAIPVSATVTAAAVHAFDRRETVRGTIGGVAFSGKADTDSTWGEFGARIEAGITDDTSIAVGITGTTGDAAGAHALIGINYKL